MSGLLQANYLSPYLKTGYLTFKPLVFLLVISKQKYMRIARLKKEIVQEEECEYNIDQLY